MGSTTRRQAPALQPRDTGRQRQSTPATDPQRERILAAASRRFARQGYAGTTLEQIVQDLGMSKPFLYYYFRDKQEIFETLSWAPAVECFTSMDFPPQDERPAREKVEEGLRRLVRATVVHHPRTFFPYREPQVYRPEYLAAQRRLAQHFYARLCPLLDEGRRDGDFAFEDTRLTAMAACSIPGFLYTWYKPGGRLGPEQVVEPLVRMAMRVIGLRTTEVVPKLDR